MRVVQHALGRGEEGETGVKEREEVDAVEEEGSLSISEVGGTGLKGLVGWRPGVMGGVWGSTICMVNVDVWVRMIIPQV